MAAVRAVERNIVRLWQFQSFIIVCKNGSFVPKSAIQADW
jgi:hypothetical protein